MDRMDMIVTKKIEEARSHVRQWEAEGNTIGLCPTMGYLHEGHMSLMEASIKDNDKTVATIFVNPMQFGPTEDLDKYPRDFKRDCSMLEDAGVDMVFAPEPSDMYEDDFCSFVDMSIVTETLCGKSRPVMFRGVCTVLTKFINIIHPSRMYMGKKDCQQFAVVRQMVKDLNFDLEVIGCPTVRESDGLAKSSRNTYLNTEERQAARVLSRSLRKAQEAVISGEKKATVLKDMIIAELKSEPMSDIDYVEVVNGLTMQPIDEVKNGDLVAIAVRIGTTRLIDNFIVGDPLITGDPLTVPLCRG